MGQVNFIRIGRNHLKDGGSITVTCGILAHEPIKGSAIIGMSNTGLEGFVRASSLELDNFGINAVSNPIGGGKASTAIFYFGALKNFILQSQVLAWNLIKHKNHPLGSLSIRYKLKNL